MDKKTNRRSKRPPVFVKKGQIVIARIDCTQPICVETYNDYQQLGRFTIRDEGILFYLWFYLNAELSCMHCR